MAFSIETYSILPKGGAPKLVSSLFRGWFLIAKQPGENFAAPSELESDLIKFAMALRQRGNREMSERPDDFLTEMFAELNYIHPR